MSQKLFSCQVILHFSTEIHTCACAHKLVTFDQHVMLQSQRSAMPTAADQPCLLLSVRVCIWNMSQPLFQG